MQNLILDSRDRIGSISNGIFELDSTIENFSRVKVNWISMYNTFYNVTGGNNIITMVNSGVIVIPPGNYTMELLGTTLDGLLKQIDEGMSVTYDSVSNRVYWSIAQLHIDIENSTAKHLLGLKNMVGSQDSSFYTIINLGSPSCVSLYSPELQAPTVIRTSRSQIQYNSFLTVPIFASYAQLNYYEPKNLYFEYSKTVLNRLSLHLRSETGEKLYNLTDFIISLNFFE